MGLPGAFAARVTDNLVLRGLADRNEVGSMDNNDVAVQEEETAETADAAGPGNVETSAQTDLPHMETDPEVTVADGINTSISQCFRLDFDLVSELRGENGSILSVDSG